MERVDLIVHAGVVITMNPQREMIRDAAVAVKGQRIVAIDKIDAITRRYEADRILGDSGKLVFPGLIDCHNHSIHFMSKGIVDDMPYPKRHHERVWPYEAGLTPEESYASATGTMLEMIRRGTTTFMDPGTPNVDSVGRAISDIGMRGVVSRLTWDVHDPKAPAAYNDTTEQAATRGEEAVSRWHGAAGGRVHAAFSLSHQEHVTPELATLLARRATELGVPIQSHLSVTRAALEAAIAKWGQTPVERYHRFGVLGPNAVMVHMGGLTEGDVAILANTDTTVCHCPSASMFGGFGTISHGRFPELIEKGVRVVLGTDACAISRSLDMVRLMYLAACAHKDAKIDPTVIGAHKAMEMATVDAAKALLWDNEIGSLEVGKLADIVIAETDSIEWQPHPFDNPVGNLIYSSDGSCVRTVVIDGKIVMEDREIQTIDVEQAIKRTVDLSRNIHARIGATARAAWPIV
jgi:cytosine/adenosine deaminase-related metal-dependent hydrolase